MKRLITLALFAATLLVAGLSASDIPLPTCYPCGDRKGGK